MCSGVFRSWLLGRAYVRATTNLPASARDAASPGALLLEGDSGGAANAAAKAKGRYLQDKFYRPKSRRGYKRAAAAMAHKILVAIYHRFSHQVCDHELGDAYLDKRNKHHLTRNLGHRLERLGYAVTWTPQGKAALRKVIFMTGDLAQQGACVGTGRSAPSVHDLVNPLYSLELGTIACVQIVGKTGGSSEEDTKSAPCEVL
jgi:hypothetical protein